MDYTWKNLNFREFEIVACNFANDMFPNYEWKLTTSTRDDNHDFYAEIGVFSKWGEAKHSKNSDQIMSRSKWDPTLVSAKLINSVNDILLITCANIPLSYVIRSFQMSDGLIENVFCINRHLLNEWYSNRSNKLSCYNINMSSDEICKKIQRTSLLNLPTNQAQIYFFSSISKDFLTIKQSLIAGNVYTVNIGLFTISDSVNVQIFMGNNIVIISDIEVKNVSYLNQNNKIKTSSENNFYCAISKGYSIINFVIHIEENNNITYQNTIKIYMNQQCYKRKIKIIPNTLYNKNYLLEIEKKINSKSSKSNSQNKIIKTDYISPELYNRPNYKFMYISFDERRNYNSSKICRLVAHIVTSIDFSALNEISVRDNIYICDYPEYFENIILGIFNDFLAEEVIEIMKDNIADLFLINKQPSSTNCIYIIENYSKLTDEQMFILGKVQNVFSAQENNNYMILQNAENLYSNIIINDEIALIGIFETGILSKHICKNHISVDDSWFVQNIEKNLYFPGDKANIILILDYIIKKDKKSLETFFNAVINIAADQSWSSKLLDFMLLIKDKIPDEFYYNTVRRLRDVYYTRTDFNLAYLYSKILNHDKSAKDMVYIDDKYKEADELNHCGSIVEARKIFDEIADIILDTNNPLLLSKGLEAKTEVFNISFWLLDTKGLIESINKVINTYYFKGIKDIKSNRDFYPYYNCLNRKMVTEYLLGNYTDAERTYHESLNIIKLKNYIAFAHMDSARGLYYKNVNCAFERINLAYDILSELFCEKQEIRRYYDCKIEKAYLEFILSENSQRQDKLKDLNNAIFYARKYGFKNILKKSYFKLSACFIVMGNKDKAQYYLKKIYEDPYFKESPRNQLMYNELMKGYYYLLNQDVRKKYLNDECDYCDAHQPIEFNCFESENNNKFYIETRLW